MGLVSCATQAAKSGSVLKSLDTKVNRIRGTHRYFLILTAASMERGGLGGSSQKLVLLDTLPRQAYYLSHTNILERELQTVSAKHRETNIALQEFRSRLLHLTKQRDAKVITSTDFQHRYWATVRWFVRKNGWYLPVGVMNEADLSKAWQTVNKYGWRRLLGKPPKKRRIRGRHPLMPDPVRLPSRSMGGRRSDCIWW